jgi:glycine hydroxymethyltransferase
MRQIASWIGEVLGKPEDAATHKRIRDQVRELCTHFPAPAAIDPS